MGGYLLFDHEGRLVDGSALYYGYGYTNNEAKAMASRALHEVIVTMIPFGKTVVVYRDSALVMGFLIRTNRPGKASLLMIMWYCSRLVWGYDCRAHRACLSTSYVGPWYCDRCIDSLAEKYYLTLDRELLKYLVAGSLPDDPEEA